MDRLENSTHNHGKAESLVSELRELSQTEVAAVSGGIIIIGGDLALGGPDTYQYSSFGYRA